MGKKHVSIDDKRAILAEVAKGEETKQAIAQRHGLHPTTITNWLNDARALMPRNEIEIRSKGPKGPSTGSRASYDDLVMLIGQLTLELRQYKNR